MFFNRPHFFPKQLFFRFLLQQILGVVPILLVSALGTRLYLESRLSNFHSVQEVVRAYDRAFLFLGFVMGASFLGITLWTGYRLVFPLGRILVKARSILKRDYLGPTREEEGTEDGVEEPSEWSDLESTLHRIGKDMQSKDLSLSKEREEIEAIISAISEAVVAIDRLGNVLFYNSQFAVLFGQLPGKNLRLSDYIRKNDVLDAFRRCLQTGSPQLVEPELLLKGELTSRFFSLSITSLKMEDGQIYGAVGVFHDVTELKRMEQIRIDFVANVSHELRSPLTSIKGYAQTLKTDLAENPTAFKFLDTIERNSDRLIALVQDLLNLSSLESGAELKFEEVNLEDLTKRVLAVLEPQRAAKEHEITVSIDYPGLWADSKRVEQVLYNLLENAIKYVPAHGKIEVKWESSQDETRLRVIDNGPGIPVEHHIRIFERFYRVDGARTREAGGTGLGLAIVKHIVQRHGGKVRVQSAPLRGTEFQCSFPHQKAH